MGGGPAFLSGPSGHVCHVINCRANDYDVVIIKERSYPSNVESFVEVSLQPGR